MAKSFKFDGLLKEAEKQKAQSETFLKLNITIREDFKTLIPPLSEEEFRQLEENILREGCRDPLVVWKKGEEYILIDGHNRFVICSQHKLDYKIQAMDFADEEQAKDWMVNNQLGKRNVTEETKSYLRGVQYSREKQKTANIQNLKQFSEEDSLSLSGNTAQRLAELFKVSDKTIKRDEKYAEGIDKLSGENKQLKWDILNNKIQVPKNMVMELASKEADLVRKIGELLLQNIDIKEAIKLAEQQPAKELKPKEVNEFTQKTQELKTRLVTGLNAVIKKADKNAFAEIKKLMEELERLLFAK